MRTKRKSRKARRPNRLDELRSLGLDKYQARRAAAGLGALSVISLFNKHIKLSRRAQRIGAECFTDLIEEFLEEQVLPMLKGKDGADA